MPAYQQILCLLQLFFTANYVFTFATARQNGSLAKPPFKQQLLFYEYTTFLSFWATAMYVFPSFSWISFPASSKYLVGP